MVGASPGGGTDILARVLADKFAPVLKQPVTVENRPGASNTIAGELTARAPADGATLLLATNTAQAVAPHILKLKYDPLKDLQPIGLVAVMPNVLVVSANSPYKSVKDLVAAMAAKPGGFKYASSGIGSTQHVGGEAFNLATGMKSIHVPYKGSSQAHIDIIGRGRHDVRQHLLGHGPDQGRQVPRAGRERAAALARIARRAHAGRAGHQGRRRVHLVRPLRDGRHAAPRGRRLSAELVRTLKLADVQARIKGWAASPAPDRRPFAAMNKQEFDHYGQLVRDANIKAE
jgi:hypothetical protein